MADMTEVKLNTTGLHCRSCSMLVDMTVGELDGVAEVHTDHATGETIVSFDPDAISITDIVTAIREAGYDAEPAEQ